MTDTPERLGVLEVKVDSIEEKVDRVLILLEGNGQPSNGIVVRLDRLEQRADYQKWYQRAGVTAMVAVIGRWVYDALHK